MDNAVRHFESRKTVREAVAGLARVQPNCVQRPNSGEFGYENTSQRAPMGLPFCSGRSYLGLRPVRRCRGDRAPPQASTASPVRGFLPSAFGESLQSWLRPKAALFYQPVICCFLARIFARRRLRWGKPNGDLIAPGRSSDQPKLKPRRDEAAGRARAVNQHRRIASKRIEFSCPPTM